MPQCIYAIQHPRTPHPLLKLVVYIITYVQPDLKLSNGLYSASLLLLYISLQSAAILRPSLLTILITDAI